MDMNRLYNMDCMEGMREFPDGHFDLALVDPPYGSGYESARDSYSSLWDRINAKRGHPWASDPWVWAYTFERLEGGEGK